MLKDGKIEAEGTLEELLLTCEEMKHLWLGDPAFWAQDKAEDVEDELAEAVSV